MPEYAHSIILGLVISVSIAGAAIVYMTGYAHNLDDKYQIITDVEIISDSSNIHIIKVTYTNAGDKTLELFEGTILDCVTCNHTETIDVAPHTSSVISWFVKNETVRDGIINIHYTFDDKTVVTKTQRLR